ncbi:MAG: phosphotransferase [Mojavia pulchra JT2-VF2]|jgi:Ser/Thr protein kinase RdoA (MazF antagonist)|uniref:Phosphotransferase n=1 Tax=Mojavia pulchra JT2-VF2 TaxID=287848 RepID=A0A951Q909_9NOST|nr:phosphotransferase [Mojavia pulchra JT2-VF2]
MIQISLYEYIAETALERYNLAQMQLKFLGHSGSVTYFLETQTGKFLLRIHFSISRKQDDIWGISELIESELMWLNALSHSTEIVVQQPVKNLEDRWVTQVLVDETEEVFYCSLLHWIDGDIINTPLSLQQAYLLGSLLAKLHKHSSQWQLPPNFVRPVYDKNRFQLALSEVQKAVSLQLISAENYNVLELAACQVQNVIKSLSPTKDTWGLIHADLHDGNYLLHNEEIRPIDFARCGFGYYLYDLASTLQYLIPSVRPFFCEGYQAIRKLPENYLQITEGFFIMAVIDVLSFHVNNPKEHKWISQTVLYVVKEHVHPYLKGEPFLFQKY